MSAPKYYLATYGKEGLDVKFFSDEAEYDEAVSEAENDRSLDIYINDEMPEHA